MKHYILCCISPFFAFAACFGFLSVALAQEAEKERPPQRDFGSVRVITLQDAASEFPASLFPTASKKQLEKYMPDGKAPSTVSTFLLRVPGMKMNGNIVREKNILFDTGNGNDRSELLERLKHLEIPLEEIDEIYLTHMHGDHIGGLLKDGKRTFPNAKVFSSKPEYDYWCPDGGDAKNPKLDAVKKAYGKDFSGLLKFDQKIEQRISFASDRYLKGKITVIEAVGHTPGHVCFLIESEGQKLMVVGDLLHAAAIQFPVPDLCPRYDMDTEKAVASRKRILEMAAKEQIPIAGMHFPAPGVGYVKKGTEGGYVFRPIKETLSLILMKDRESGKDSCRFYDAQKEEWTAFEGDDALKYLETQLKTGRYSLVTVSGVAKAVEDDVSRDFFKKLVVMLERYEIVYSVHDAQNLFPGSPNMIFPPKK